MERSLIEKYFIEGLSEEETSQLLAWLEKDEISRKYFAELKSLWVFSGIGGVNQTEEADREANRLLSRLSVQDTSGKQIILKKYFRVTGIAAGILALLVSILLLFLQTVSNGKSSYYTVETRASEKSLIYLADGTAIWLNAETNIKIPEKINCRRVDIYLQGEAFFDIPHLKGRKVVVHASDLQIKVIGTAFNVKNYPGERQIETTLVRGKVVIEKSLGNKVQNLAEINPNQRYVYDREKKQGIIPSLDNIEYRQQSQEKMVSIAPTKRPVENTKPHEEVDIYIAWKDGRFIFRSEPFQTLTKKMERWFGVTIVNNYSILNAIKFNGSFEKENIEQAIRALSTSYPFGYRISRDTVYIMPR